MPALNKQTLINLLIDSPLREPIKINLIDIVNNTQDTDLPKVYPTVIKELEIFQKATDRRMKLADETIVKLNEGGVPKSDTVTPDTATPPTSLPPLPPLPAMPTMPSMPPTPTVPAEPAPLSVPPLDLPPLPTIPTPVSPAHITEPTPAPTAPAAPATSQADADEAALSEIQKELDALKTGAATDAGTAK